jgi:protein-tyrosine phosphatase
MRDLDWDGSRNVRDLGELPTPLSPTGATIAGRIARGPRRELLTAAGWIAATEWGLRSVVDLRSVDEVGPRDADPNAVPPAGLEITLAPTEDQTHSEFRAVCLPILDSPEYWQHNVRILPSLVRGALEAIAASEPGVLVHCAGGRDRTGMVSALLLAHAGVSPDHVVADYAESVHAMAGTASHGGLAHDRQASWTLDQADAWLAEVESHVRAFVADPDLVLDELEVHVDTRVTLRSLLTSEY